MQAFIQALTLEAQTRLAALQSTDSGTDDTLYFGGGTPSMLSDKHLGALIESLGQHIDIAALAEFSFEANPCTFTAIRARRWRNWGITRVSLGVQSFDPHILTILGREHTPEQAIDSVQMLYAANIPHINIDLMFAIPGQSLDCWATTLHTASLLPVDHISTYNLTFEEDTAFFKSLKAGKLHQNDDNDADYFELADILLTNAGFRHYETSNYAKPHARSLHNMAYWQGKDYIGIGPGAVGTVHGIRYTNTPDTTQYIQSTLSTGLPQNSQETISLQDYRLERIALMLRTDEGLPLHYLSQEIQSTLPRYIEAGYAMLTSTRRFILTGKGKLLVDAIAAELC